MPCKRLASYPASTLLAPWQLGYRWGMDGWTDGWMATTQQLQRIFMTNVLNASVKCSQLQQVVHKVALHSKNASGRCPPPHRLVRWDTCGEDRRTALHAREQENWVGNSHTMSQSLEKTEDCKSHIHACLCAAVDSRIVACKSNDAVGCTAKIFLVCT